MRTNILPLSDFKYFLSHKINKDNIISVFVVGSVVNNVSTFLSDIDIVIIGEKDNRIFQIQELRKKFLEFFHDNLKVKPVFFTDPAFERIFYMYNSPPSFPLVQLVYHPVDRFLSYVNRHDPVIFSWKKKYRLLFGKDVLCALKSHPKQVSHLFLINYIDNLLQMIQSLFLVSEINKHCIYYFKTFLYCSKRLLEYVEFGLFDMTSTKRIEIEQKYTKILRGIYQNFNDRKYLLDIFQIIEDDLIFIRNHLLEKKPTKID